ncbi:MAG: hypothetical protein R6U51_09195 [Anaerolineales bacterium]
MTRTPAVEGEEASIPLDGAGEVKLRVKHGAGQFRLSAGAAPDQVLSGTFGGGLEKGVKREGSRLDITLKPSRGAFPDFLFPWTWTMGGGFDWSLKINKEIPLFFDLEAGAGGATLDFSHLNLKYLQIETGVSSTTLTLPERAGHTNVKIEAGVASVSVRIPENAAARIETEGGLAFIDVNKDRFPQQGGLYISDGYETAENKIEMKIETGLGSIKVQ